MQREELIGKLLSIKPALEAEGVKHMALFGSRARGDHEADSDLDILLEVDPGTSFSLLDLVGVEHIVSDLTGLKAHATMRRSVEARFGEGISKEAVTVY